MEGKKIIFHAGCDQTFVSVHGGPQNGTFQAPVLINQKGESQQCVYTFLAAQNQRVEVVFTSFGLRGTPPELVFTYFIFIFNK